MSDPTWKDLPDSCSIEIVACANGDVFIKLDEPGDIGEPDHTARVYVGAKQAREIGCRLIEASYIADA